MSIQVKGDELVYRRAATGSIPESTTHYLILGVRPRDVRSESRLVDDHGQHWQTGCACINPKGLFGESFDRMVCWKVGEADARDGQSVFRMQQQRRPVGSSGQWENWKPAFQVQATGWSGRPYAFRASAVAYLRWLPKEQPGFEWRGRVSQDVSGFAGRPHTVYPDGIVVPDN
ncbi:hypothetical protein [Streptomyces sp. NBC_01304]|uniref:hypothetical protein n=1 Tax=Streptomyces sp. NBC_01304 TaxID=2903818 RepID=UPI002E0E8A7A|nr:hypothetical protein OG430_41005 [Streptomyces sp. NBC_01304]